MNKVTAAPILRKKLRVLDVWSILNKQLKNKIERCMNSRVSVEIVNWCNNIVILTTIKLQAKAQRPISLTNRGIVVVFISCSCRL